MAASYRPLLLMILFCIGCRCQKSTAKVTDPQLLNYALVLERLQVALYSEGLANYTKQDFTGANFSSSTYSDFSAILSDEQSHVSNYESALQKINETAVPNCTYNFGVTDVESFVNLTNKLEGVVVSAYLGIETSINTSSYLTAVNTIMTVEARHSTFIRYGALRQKPFPSPYDIPLDFNSTWTLIAPFIESCPATAGQMPPIENTLPFPILGYENTTYPINANDTIYLETQTVALVPKKQGIALYAAWATHGSPNYVPVTAVDSTGMRFKTTVPKSIAGQSYVWLTACNDSLTDAVVLAGPALLEVGD